MVLRRYVGEYEWQYKKRLREYAINKARQESQYRFRGHKTNDGWQKVCVFCGKKFSAVHKQKRYCSDKCALAVRNQNFSRLQWLHRTASLECSFHECRKRFVPIRQGQKYCSKSCRFKNKDLHSLKSTKYISNKRCINCKDIFLPKRSDALYCTPKCRQAAYRLRQKKESD